MTLPDFLRSRGVRIVWGGLLMGMLFSCAGRRPDDLGVRDDRLAVCSSRPNCVSSDDRRTSHRVAPFELSAPPTEAWSALREVVSGLSRTTVVTSDASYLHAECESALLGFVDDLELHLRPGEHVVAVRSASRLGYSDLGANRRRIEDLRRRLQEQGIVR